MTGRRGDERGGTRRGGGFLGTLAAAAVGGLATAVTLMAVGLVGGGGAAIASGASGEDVRRVYASAGPGVVAVRAEGRTGSAFLMEGGHLLTNAHVVGTAGRVEVSAGTVRVPATVRGVEASVDVAVLSLDRPLDGLRPLPWGDSAALQVGDPVIAIGAPFGLERSVTTGIVSGLGRMIDSPNGFAITGVIQTDAALNPGNSGGPLLDTAGRVVGVATQIATEGGRNEGIGFAVPAATARRSAEALAAEGHAAMPYLGVVGEDVEGGVRLSRVLPGGPAEGLLLPADVLVAVERRAVRSNADLAVALAAHAPGAAVEVEVRRGGAERSVEVVLGARAPEGPVSAPR